MRAEMPSKLRRDRRFQSCPTALGDELFANGVFEFNITRLLGFITAHPERAFLVVLANQHRPEDQTHRGEHPNEAHVVPLPPTT
jgi:hypothetical protein